MRNVSVAALLGAGEGEIAVVLLELTLNSEPSDAPSGLRRLALPG